jgi:hypothetical protein
MLEVFDYISRIRQAASGSGKVFSFAECAS